MMGSNNGLKRGGKCILGVKMYTGGFFMVRNGNHFPEKERRPALIKLCNAAGFSIKDFDAGRVDVFEGNMTKGSVSLDREIHLHINGQVAQFHEARPSEVVPLKGPRQAETATSS